MAAQNLYLGQPENLMLKIKPIQRIASLLLSCSSFCLFLFTVETLSQPVPKSSCDFVWQPQLTMLPLKNSSLNNATLTSTHETSTHKHTHTMQTPALLYDLLTQPILLLQSVCFKVGNGNLQGPR